MRFVRSVWIWIGGLLARRQIGIDTACCLSCFVDMSLTVSWWLHLDEVCAVSVDLNQGVTCPPSDRDLHCLLFFLFVAITAIR